MTHFDLPICTTATALSDCPALAHRADVGRVLVKVESERPFGNFKILGGMTAEHPLPSCQCGGICRA
jgi:diaminopropionate ammonia-lyase